MKRIFALLLALCLVFSVATVLSSCGDKENVIVIGVYEPASGDNGAGGKKETLGVKYANSVKNKVTVNGVEYTVKLEIVDNQSSNDKAVSAASALLDKKAVVALGSYGSGVSMAASQTFKDGGIPAIGITCTNPQVTEGNDHYFRVCFLDPFQGTVLANYAKNELGATKAYVLACTGSDYDNGLANYFNQAFGSTTNNFPANTADFTSYVQAAIDAEADVIFCPVSVNYAQLIIDAAHALNFQGTILGGDTLDDNMVVDAADKAGDVQVHITTFYQEGAAPEFDNGFKAWLNANPTMLQENGGNDMVSAVSAMGYDAYMTALYAIEHA
ncbi:MAG: ABC transporter substrate-binding protein, partial [Clostridia bacterium]|nr:ABC transporter substrate-binding protein [Clostridia bacterium]